MQKLLLLCIVFISPLLLASLDIDEAKVHYQEQKVKKHLEEKNRIPEIVSSSEYCIMNAASNGHTSVELCIEDYAVKDVDIYLATNKFKYKNLGHSSVCDPELKANVSLIIVSGWTNDIEGE